MSIRHFRRLTYAFRVLAALLLPGSAVDASPWNDEGVMIDPNG